METGRHGLEPCLILPALDYSFTSSTPKKGYGFVTGEDGEDYFAHFSQIKMEGFKRLSGKQPVQFEVGADENGREIAVNIVPLTTGEEA